MFSVTSSHRLESSEIHLRFSYSSSSASYKCKYRVELLLGHWVLEFQTPVGFNYCTKHFSSFSGVSKADLTDLTSPYTWYPNARRKNRRVILHVGPTNSGKTYHALKQL